MIYKGTYMTKTFMNIGISKIKKYKKNLIKILAIKYLT